MRNTIWMTRVVLQETQAYQGSKSLKDASLKEKSDHLRMGRNMNNQDEELLREYVRMQLSDSILNEGISDLFKKGVGAVLSKISKMIDSLKQMTPTSDAVIDVLEKNGADSAVAQIGTVGEQFESSMAAADKSVPAPKQESFAFKRYQRVILERRTSQYTHKKTITEVGVFESVGLVLAAIGGIPLILKAAYKLAALMKFEKAAEKIKVAYEASHHFEEKVIDIVIPDKAIYAVYMMFEERSNPDKVANLNLYVDDPKSKLDGERSMTLEEFRKSDTRKKYEKRAYALILLPWIVSGLVSIEHMLHGWIGAVEGAATAEKSVFVGTQAVDVARKIAGEFTAAAAGVSETV